MHLLYSIFIMPLESLMRFVLENSHNFTDSYGIAILLVSLIVSFGVLPLYHFAEKLQDKERSIQSRMKSKLDELKSVYKGAELHAYVKNLYRLHGYHPIFGLRSLIGLAIQIPFFIAAYHLLSNYTDLSGKSFLFFGDLSKPDGLLSMGGMSLNIMPFVMTAVNLVSAFIYGKKISVKENVQLYVTALVFLVLLYGSPSGLLLYWTYNNIFNLFKNIAYRIFSSKENLEDKSVREKITLGAMVLNVKVSFKKIENALYLHYDIIMTAFILVLLYLFIGYLPDIKQSTSLSKMIISISAMIVFVVNAYMIAIMLSLSKKTLKAGMLALRKNKIIFLSIMFFVLSILYLSTYFHLYGKHIYSVRLLLIMFGLISLIINAVFIGSNKDSSDNRMIPAAKKNKMPIAECVMFLFFFCCFIPFIIFLPSADDLGGGLIDLMLFILKALFAISLVLIGSLFAFRKKYIVLAELILVFIFTGITFGYVYQKDFGIMRGLSFVNEKALNVNMPTALIDIIIIMLIVILVKKFYRKYRKEILICLVLVFVIQLTAFYISNSEFKGEDVSITDSSAENEASYAEKEKKLLSDLSFSKDKDNIFILFLDGFPGFLATDLIKKYPEYTKEMDGFVFYRNTVSIGCFTFPSYPAMLGGHKSDIDRLNAITDKTYGEKYQEIMNQHSKYFNKHGFKPVYCNIPFAKNWNAIRKNGGSIISKDELILFRKKHGEPYKTKYAKQAFEFDLEKLEKSSLDDKILIKLCLFKVLPYLHKHQVYFKTDKIFEKGEQYGDSYFYRRYVISDSLWSSLPAAINATSDGPTIKWIRTAAMNRPYHINEFGGPPIEETRSKKYNTGGYNEVFMTANYEFELLAKVFKRMKDLNIYDNTTIILVSDHGIAYGGNWHDSAINPMLMIKERNSRGLFKISDKLMSNADIHAITTYIASGKSDDVIDNPLLNNQKRTVKYYATIHGNPSDLKKSVLPIDSVREISDTIIGKYKWPSIFKESTNAIKEEYDNKKPIVYNWRDMVRKFSKDVEDIEYSEDNIIVHSRGKDPYVEFKKVEFASENPVIMHITFESEFPSTMSVYYQTLNLEGFNDENLFSIITYNGINEAYFKMPRNFSGVFRIDTDQNLDHNKFVIKSIDFRK